MVDVGIGGFCRFGCRAVIVAAVVLYCLMLPLLAVFSDIGLLALSLFIFGGGGVADAGAAGRGSPVAGGGWSALTVTTLVARGVRPRMVIGTVHLAKCVVSAVASISFFVHVGFPHGASVAGLIVGGVVAAPLSALLARRMPPRVATVLAALAVLGIGINNIAHTLLH